MFFSLSSGYSLYRGRHLACKCKDKRSITHLDLSYVFNLSGVLKDVSTIRDVAGKVSAIRMTLRTAGKKKVVSALPD